MEIKSFRFLIALVFISYQTNIQGFQDVNILENDGKILNENSDPTFEYFSKIDSKTIFNSEDINRKNPLFGVTLDLTKTFDKNNKELILKLFEIEEDESVVEVFTHLKALYEEQWGDSEATAPPEHPGLVEEDPSEELSKTEKSAVSAEEEVAVE